MHVWQPRLTGFKIDIKSETQARESGELYDYDDEDEYYDEDEYSEEDTEETAEDYRSRRSCFRRADRRIIYGYKK